MSGLRPLWRPRGTDAWVAAAAAAFVGALSATSTAGRSAKCCVTFRALLHSILTWMGLLSDQAGLGSFLGAITSTIDRSSESGFAKRGSHIIIYSYFSFSRTEPHGTSLARNPSCRTEPLLSRGTSFVARNPCCRTEPLLSHGTPSLGPG